MYKKISLSTDLKRYFSFYFLFKDWRSKWQPTPVFLPGKFHGQRSLAGYSPWGRKESDTTGRLSLTANTQVKTQSLAQCLACWINLPSELNIQEMAKLERTLGHQVVVLSLLLIFTKN